MKIAFDESQLQIVAAQMASLRANEPQQGFLARAASRIRRDFLQKGLREKAKFVRFAARESISRLANRMRRTRRPESGIKVNVPHDRLLVAARLNGGLGDLIIYGAFLDRFFHECGRPLIHVVVTSPRLEEARFVFHRSPAVALVTDAADLDPASTPYDVAMTLGDFPSYDFIRRERARRIAPAMFEKLTAARDIQQPYRPFIDAQPLFDGHFATTAAQSGVRRLDLLGWLGNVDFTQEDQLRAAPDIDGYRRFDDLGLANRPYITLHNGWDNIAHRNTQNATKGWPLSHYKQFVAGFKRRFPHVLIVQLGAKTSRPIVGVDLCLLENTTLHEAAWILKHSLLHLDGDSGLVHLARALHTKSLVLFGPTNHEFFRYAQNENCFSTVCGNCWWSTKNWMQSCPRGLGEPECMKSIEPEHVLKRTDKYLRSLRSPRLKFEDSRRSPDGSFDAWRGRFVLDALASATANSRVAILDAAGLPPSLTAEAGHHVRTFSFHDEEADTMAPRNYGSLYNIPEENNSFDLVVMPLVTDRTRHVYAAVKEALRIVRENGHLIITFQFESDLLHHALVSLGADDGVVPSGAGGIVLRKASAGQLFAERHARRFQLTQYP